MKRAAGQCALLLPSSWGTGCVKRKVTFWQVFSVTDMRHTRQGRVTLLQCLMWRLFRMCSMFCCGLISFFTVLSLGTFITTTTVLISHDNFLRVKGDLFNYHLPFIVMSQYFLPQTLLATECFFPLYLDCYSATVLNYYNKMFLFVYGFVILSTAKFWRGCNCKELCEGEVMPGQWNTTFTFNNGTRHLVSIVKMKSSHTSFWSNKLKRKSGRQGTHNELSPVSLVLVFI